VFGKGSASKRFANGHAKLCMRQFTVRETCTVCVRDCDVAVSLIT